MYFYYLPGERLWPEPSQYLNTIADGIQLQSVGHVTFPILLQLAEKEVFEMASFFLDVYIGMSAYSNK